MAAGNHSTSFIRKRSRWALAGLSAALLAGCASGPTGSEVLTGSITPGQGRVVVYRDSPVGLALQPSYTLNGHQVGTAQLGFVVCNVPPGRHVLTADNLAGDNSEYGFAPQRQEIDVKAGETVYLRAEPVIGLVVGYISLIPVSAEQGRSDTQNLGKTQSACA